ncbi:hypothetical protein [Eubacterium sp.]|uniref:hypothetical protein n=1 Tax=Eubacterium sp. TaxID=142586 RepID=UPI0025F830B7|nr:hypothetical protein [Eubacterium sp.]MCR5629846.1 hypothetical protein [Eubacterium sp.]
MKKKAYFLALGIAVLGLSGCGKSTSDETEKTTVVTTEKQTEETTTIKETETVTVKETETVTEQVTENKETQTQERRTKKVENGTDYVITETDTKKEATVDDAKKYVGKTLSELTDAVGMYNNFETAGACLDDENELNGIATFANFTVYCHSVEGQTKWIIDAIE